MSARRWMVPATVLGTFVLVFLLLALQGIPPRDVLPELWRGAFGTPGALATTLQRMVPLALCGLGVAMAFRCGLWNIGAEGQLLVGAMGGVWVALATGNAWLALLAGMLGGGGYAWLAAFLRETRHVPEVLSTIMLNFVALELLRYQVSGPLQEGTGQFPQTDTIPAGAWLPEWSLTPTSGVPLGLGFAIVAALVLWPFLSRTRAGLLIRATRDAPRLVQSAGFSPSRMRLLAMSLSGALAGLAGATGVTGVSHLLDRSVAQGTGYAAIAVALLAGLRPLWVLPSALLFAALDSGTDSLQWAADRPGIDRFAEVVQGLVILSILLVLSRRRAASGSPAHG